jgi:sugar (pentulose or hexulose) kinase
LALVGTGRYSSVPELCGVAIREIDAVEPDLQAAAAYTDGHRSYQALYPALRPFYRRQ